MPQSMTRTGVAAGKHERSTEGPVGVIYDEYDLATYDPDSDGTGNDFNPRTEYGFDRLLNVDVQVADSSSYDARFDYANDVIRLYNRDGTGEVGNNVNVNVSLRIEVRGIG